MLKLVIIVSCDDINKLNVGGGMMVSRYHQINRIFMVDDTPDYDDHDFNQPSYKLSVSGYTSLEFDVNIPIDVQAISDDIFTEVDFNINENPFENFLRKRENEDIKALMNDIIHTVKTGSKSVPLTNLIKDSIDRFHIRTPHSVPALLVARLIKYQPSNIVGHLSDLETVLCMSQHLGESSVLLTVDGGPDWPTTSLTNIYFYHSFWRQKELTLLTVTSYAPGFSAYNRIEQLWSPVSKRFTSAKANPCAECDDVPPIMVPGISDDQLISKENEVFDRITDEVCQNYLI